MARKPVCLRRGAPDLCPGDPFQIPMCCDLPILALISVGQAAGCDPESWVDSVAGPAWNLAPRRVFQVLRSRVPGVLPSRGALPGEGESPAVLRTGSRADTSLVEDVSCKEAAAQNLRISVMRSLTRGMTV